MSKDIRRYLVFLELLESEEGLVTSSQIETELKKEGLSFSTSSLNRDYKFLVDIGFKIHNVKTKGYKLDIDDTDNFSLLTNLFKRIAFSNVLNKNITLKKEIHKYLALEEGSAQRNFRYFDMILEAIQNRCEIKFQHTSYYHTDRTSPKTHVVKPHLLKEYQNRWYVVGETDQGFRVFGLDRITELERLDSPPFKNKTDLANAHLYHTVGLNASDYEPTHVILRFNESQKPYLESLKLHHSQKEDLENYLEGFYTISLFVSYNFELKQQLLKYGSLLEVVAPDFIRNDIKDELLKATKNYS